MTFQFPTFFAAAFVALATATAVHANDIPVPSGDVILTISGQTQATNVDDTLQFDLESLTALGLTTIETETIWTEGVQKFEGVALSTLIELAGVETGTLRATAINDYTVEIPVEDGVVDGPIVAVFANGEKMSVRDKGPLWIVYPYDASSDYRSEVIYSRSIWQLDRIEIVE